MFRLCLSVTILKNGFVQFSSNFYLMKTAPSNPKYKKMKFSSKISPIVPEV